VKPTRLAANRFPRFYRGGSAIDELRGMTPETGGAFLPEDWVGSATTAFGSAVHGLTRLEDGLTLREAIEADPEGFLGRRHAEAYGGSPALLVKLLHAGERLPVHCHPGRGFARRHLGCPWGKTEAWIIAGTWNGMALPSTVAPRAISGSASSWRSAVSTAPDGARPS